MRSIFQANFHVHISETMKEMISKIVDLYPYRLKTLSLGLSLGGFSIHQETSARKLPHQVFCANCAP